jgi:hypothetical protein
MARGLTSRRQALTDQALKVVRDAGGFPVSTGEVARALGERLVSFSWYRPHALPRPRCWPEDLEDPRLDGNAYCERCQGFHRPPVWRRYQGDDVRPLLARLERLGEVERVVVGGVRRHYWRSSNEKGADPP